jgi:hypothetical protein
MAIEQLTATELDAPLGAPLFPPRDWFTTIPAGSGIGTPEGALVWVGTEGADRGRFAAVLAPDDACILDGQERPNRCFKPPTGPDVLEYAHVGATKLDDGSEIRTARLPGGINHKAAGDWQAAVDHYAHTGSGVARVRYVHMPEMGVTVALGVADPDMTLWAALMARGGAISGDWRWVEEAPGGGYRLAGAQTVNIPGFRYATASATATPTIAALTVTQTDDAIFTGWILAAAAPPEVPLIAAEPAAPTPTPKEPEMTATATKPCNCGKTASAPKARTAAVDPEDATEVAPTDLTTLLADDAEDEAEAEAEEADEDATLKALSDQVAALAVTVGAQVDEIARLTQLVSDLEEAMAIMDAEHMAASEVQVDPDQELFDLIMS